MRAICATVIMLLSALSLPSTAAEGPTTVACDETGRLVCAGVAVGGTVQCAGGAAVTCSITYGHSTRAFSPVGLGGSETHASTHVVTACVGGSCTTETSELSGGCAWLPAQACELGDSGAASYSFSLALGQCATVSVDSAGSISATASLSMLALADAAHAATALASGAACHVDDGRG